MNGDEIARPRWPIQDELLWRKSCPRAFLTTFHRQVWAQGPSGDPRAIPRGQVASEVDQNLFSEVFVLVKYFQKFYTNITISVHISPIFQNIAKVAVPSRAALEGAVQRWPTARLGPLG